MLTLIPASVVVGSIITRTAHYRWAIWAGWTLATLGTGLTVLWDAHTSKAVWVIILIILGLGHGLLLNALNTASQAVSGSGEEGAAVAMYAFLRSFGMAIGVGVGGSVFQNLMKRKLRLLHLDPSIAVQAEAYIAVLHTLGGTKKRAAVLDAYVAGFRGVFAFFCALGGLALMVCCTVRHYEMNKDLDTKHELDHGPVVGGWRLGRRDRDQSLSHGQDQTQADVQDHVHNQDKIQGFSQVQTQADIQDQVLNQDKIQGTSQEQSQDQVHNQDKMHRTSQNQGDDHIHSQAGVHGTSQNQNQSGTTLDAGRPGSAECPPGWI